MLVEEAAEVADVGIHQLVELLVRVQFRDRRGAVVIPEAAGVVPAPAGEVFPGNQSGFKSVCCWEGHGGLFPSMLRSGDHAQVSKTLAWRIGRSGVLFCPHGQGICRRTGRNDRAQDSRAAGRAKRSAGAADRPGEAQGSEGPAGAAQQRRRRVPLPARCGLEGGGRADHESADAADRCQHRSPGGSGLGVWFAGTLAAASPGD